MNLLKEARILPPVLVLPNATNRMTLDTDACIVLLQQQRDETTKLIGYLSRSLRDAERMHDTTKRECPIR